MLVVVLAAALASCGSDEPEQATDDPAPREDIAADLAPVKPDTLYVEGMPEPVTLQLYTVEQVPVATYFPQHDFEPEVVVSAEGTGVHFVASFGGVRNDDAWMRLFFPAPHSVLNDADQLQALVEEPGGLAEIEGFALEEREPGEPCPMASRMWMVSTDDSRAGFMCVSSRGDRWLLAMAAHPLEYGDGFGPRAAVVLRELRWLQVDSDGDGSPL